MSKQIYLCDVCNYQTDIKSSFVIHNNTKKHALRLKGIDPSEPKTYLCKECGRKTNDKSNFNKHLLTHKKTYEYECLACDTKFYSKKDLLIHLKSKIHFNKVLEKHKDCMHFGKTGTDVSVNEYKSDRFIKCLKNPKLKISVILNSDIKQLAKKDETDSKKLDRLYINSGGMRGKISRLNRLLEKEIDKEIRQNLLDDIEKSKEVFNEMSKEIKSLKEKISNNKEITDIITPNTEIKKLSKEKIIKEVIDNISDDEEDDEDFDDSYMFIANHDGLSKNEHIKIIENIIIKLQDKYSRLDIKKMFKIPEDMTKNTSLEVHELKQKMVDVFDYQIETKEFKNYNFDSEDKVTIIKT